MSDIILAFPVLVIYVILDCKHRAIGRQYHHRDHHRVGPRHRADYPRAGSGDQDAGICRGGKLRGESTLYIMLVEILPNCRSMLIVDGCLRVGYTIITIGILGFLGLACRRPIPIGAEWSRKV